MRKSFLVYSAIVLLFFGQASAYQFRGNIKNIAAQNIDFTGTGSVKLYNSSGGYLGQITSDSSGNYSLGTAAPNTTNLPNGTYYIAAGGLATDGKTYFPKFYSNGYGATDRQAIVVSGADVPGIDIILPEQVTISGTIKDASGVGVSGVSVSAFVKYSSPPFLWVNHVLTDGSGNFALPVPASVNLMLKTYRAGYVDTFYNGLSTPAYGEDTALTRNLSVSENGYVITINNSVNITGTVRNSAAVGLGGVDVVAFFKDGSHTYINKATTAGDGTYTLAIPANTNIMLRADGGSSYVLTYYNQEYFDWANSITMNGASSNINFTMYPGYSISGTTTPLGRIQIFNTANVYCKDTYADGAGAYSVTGLPGGFGYFVQATANARFDQWYQNAYGYGDRTTINLNANTTNINFALPTVGTISGTMKDAVGNNLSGVRVTAYLKGTNYTYVCNTTANAGTYSLSIPAGVNLVLQAATTNQFLGYPAGTWYGNSSSSTNAVTFTGTSTNINFALDSAWVISGNVLPAGTLVEAFGWQDWNSFKGSATSNASGYYSISGTGNANFAAMLKLSTGNYVTDYYNNKNNYNNLSWASDELTINIGTTTNVPVNQVLALGGTISGTITGAGAGTITINIEDTNGAYFTEVTRNGTGTYSVPRLPAGTWKVKAMQNGAVTVYYGNALTTPSATAVTVTSGGTTSNINITLPLALSISGSVSKNAGGALANARVVLFTTGNVYTTETTSNASGVYTLNNVIPGGYFVQVTSTNYYDQWYPAAYGYGDRVTVSLTTLSTSNVNFSLYSTGTISGTVSSSAGVLLGGVTVSAYVKGTNYTYVNAVTTNASGVYSLLIPVAGPQLVLQAVTNNQFLVDPAIGGAWYNGQTYGLTSSVNATTFNATASNINFTFAPRWIVSGNVLPAGTLVEIFGWQNYNQYYGSATANASGYYTISGTGNASFATMFKFTTGNYVTELYNDKNNYNNLNWVSDELTINIGTTTNIPVNQVLALGGTISGTITGAGAGTITINIEDTNGTYFTEVTRNGTGTYSVPRLPAGTWKVKAMQNGAVTVYYGNALTTPSATAVTVTSGGTTSNIDIILPLALSISGSVSKNAGGALANARVVLFTTGNVYTTETTSNASGVYTLNNVIAGGYFVQVTSTNYFDQWYPVAYGYSDRITVSLTTLPTSNVNFSLYSTGTISGTVSSSAGVLLNGVTVSAYIQGSNYKYVNAALTNGSGAYSLTIPIGPSLVLQTATTNQFLDNEWYNNLSTSVGATVFTTSANNVNFNLDQRWIVSGNVLPAGTLVEIFGWQNWNGFKGSATSNASGYYSVSGTGNANFAAMLKFSTGNYVTELYNDKNNYNNLSWASDELTINIGTTTNVPVNQSLALGGTIAGTITATGGSGLITVNIEDANGVYFTAVTTNGAFSVSCIPSGNWKVRAMRAGCVAEYFGERAGTANATTVNLFAGQTTNNINVSISPEWTIAGKVRNASGVGIAGATVQSYFYNDHWEFVSATITTADGSYTIHDGYNAGPVFVKYTAFGYADTFYDGKSDGYPTANAITMVVSTNTTGIDVTMNSAATINGIVRDDTGALLAGASVKIFNKNGLFTWRAEGTTSITGSYQITSVPANTDVMVKFEKLGYADSFYNATGNWQGAATFNISNGSTSPNINATLNRQWTITGAVTVSDVATGGSVSGSVVEVYLWKNWTWVAGTTLDATGIYSITGTGNSVDTMVRYKKSGYVDMFYPSEYSFNKLVTASNRVSIITTQTQGLSPVVLNRAGVITGIITAPTGSGTVTVNIEDVNGVYFTEFAATQTVPGTYTYSATGLPPSQWKVKALRSGCVSEYYGETVSTLNASIVTVNAGTTVNNVNIGIDAPWTISGTVIYQSGGAKVAGADVSVFTYGTWDYVASTTTNALGNFTISQGYNTQNVFVRVSTTNYVTLYYAGAITVASANSLAMAPGVATNNINFALYQYGAITGVVSSNGVLQSGVTVSAFLESDHSWYADATTNVSGVYTLPILPNTPMYIIASKNACYPQMYRNNNSIGVWASGITVSVASGVTTSNINFNLTQYWLISGRIRLSDGGTAGQTLVALAELGNSTNIVATTNTDTNGMYTFSATIAPLTPNVLVLVSKAGYDAGSRTVNAVVLGSTVTTSVDIILQAQAMPLPAGQSIKDTIKAGPNPANPNVEPIHIGLILDKNAYVSVRVYSLGGQKVYENAKRFWPGYNEFQWRGDDLFGDKIPNGVYIAYVEVDTGSEKIKKVLKIAVLK